LVREHIETERQLPAELLSSFLLALLAETSAQSGSSALRDIYKSIANQFVLQGGFIQRTSSLTALYRYVSWKHFLPNIIRSTKESREELAIDLQERYDRAARGDGHWADILQEVVVMWDVLPLSRIPLTNSSSMFVTFGDGSSIDRNSTRSVWHALALYKPMPEALLEIQIEVPPRGDTFPRFPTLADAGWYSFFCSAEEGEPHGWTKPHSHNPPYLRQPEAVLPPLNLSSVSGPLSLRVLGA
jgi:hypothetical protein